jgi:hypothetical protein
MAVHELLQLLAGWVPDDKLAAMRRMLADGHPGAAATAAVEMTAARALVATHLVQASGVAAAPVVASELAAALNGHGEADVEAIALEEEPRRRR